MVGPERTKSLPKSPPESTRGNISPTRSSSTGSTSSRILSFAKLSKSTSKTSNDQVPEELPIRMSSIAYDSTRADTRSPITVNRLPVNSDAASIRSVASSKKNETLMPLSMISQPIPPLPSRHFNDTQTNKRIPSNGSGSRASTAQTIKSSPSMTVSRKSTASSAHRHPLPPHHHETPQSPASRNRGFSRGSTYSSFMVNGHSRKSSIDYDDSVSMVSYNSRASTMHPNSFALEKPPDNEIIEEMFQELMKKRDFKSLPEAAKKQMLSYPISKKWMLIHQDALTEFNHERKRVTKAHTIDENTPEWYVRKLMDNTITQKQLGELWVSLRTEQVGWVQDFIEAQGQVALSTVLSHINQSSRHSTEELYEREYDLIKCLKALMNLRDGADNALHTSNCIPSLVRSLLSPKLATRKLVSEVLTFLAHWHTRGNHYRQLRGHDQVISALDHMKNNVNELGRFESWMRIVEQTLDGRGKMGSLVGASEEFKSGGVGVESLLMEYALTTMLLVNAIVEGTKELKVRIHIRSQFKASGLPRIAAKMQLFKYELITEQIQKYDEAAAVDYEDLLRLERSADVKSMDDPSLIAQEIWARVKGTYAEGYFLSAMQHFMLVREDPSDEGARMFQLVDAMLSHVVMDRISPDSDLRNIMNFSVQSILSRLETDNQAKKAYSELKDAKKQVQEAMAEKSRMEQFVDLGAEGNVGRLKKKMQELQEALDVQRRINDGLQSDLNEIKNSHVVEMQNRELEIRELYLMLKGRQKDTSEGILDRERLVEKLESQLARKKTEYKLEGLPWGAVEPSPELRQLRDRMERLQLTGRIADTRSMQELRSEEVKRLTEPKVDEKEFKRRTHKLPKSTQEELFQQRLIRIQRLRELQLQSNDVARMIGDDDLSMDYDAVPVEAEMVKVVEGRRAMMAEGKTMVGHGMQAGDDMAIIGSGEGQVPGLIGPVGQNNAVERISGVSSQTDDGTVRAMRREVSVVTSDNTAPAIGKLDIPRDFLSELSGKFKSSDGIAVDDENDSDLIEITDMLQKPDDSGEAIQKAVDKVGKQIDETSEAGDETIQPRAVEVTERPVKSVEFLEKAAPPPPPPPAFLSSSSDVAISSPPTFSGPSPPPPPPPVPSFSGGAPPPPPPPPPDSGASSVSNSATSTPSIGFTGGFSPIPPPLPAFNSSSNVSERARVSPIVEEPTMLMTKFNRGLRPKRKLKQMHWEKLDTVDHTIWAEKAAERENGTLETVSNELYKKGIFEEVEKIFAAKEIKKFMGKKKDQEEKISFLARDVSQQFGINLHSFSTIPVDELVMKILHCDDDILKNPNIMEFFLRPEMTDVSINLAKNLQPYSVDWTRNGDEEEMKPEKDPNDLARGDHIYLELCYNLQHYWKSRMRALLVVTTHEREYEDLVAKLKIIDEACEAVRHSQRLKDLLEIILAVGNFMNDTSKQASGFRLGTLQRLAFTKDDTNTMTFLHYVEKIVRSSFQDLEKFTEDLRPSIAASKLSVEQARNDCEEYMQTINNVQASIDIGNLSDPSKMHPEDRVLQVVLGALPEARNKRDYLSAHLKSTMGELEKLMRYYGEDSNDPGSLGSFFSKFATFVSEYQKANQENLFREEENRAYEARKRLHEQAKKSNEKREARGHSALSPTNDGNAVMDTLLEKLKAAGSHGDARSARRRAAARKNMAEQKKALLQLSQEELLTEETADHETPAGLHGASVFSLSMNSVPSPTVEEFNDSGTGTSSPVDDVDSGAVSSRGLDSTVDVTKSTEELDANEPVDQDVGGRARKLLEELRNGNNSSVGSLNAAATSKLAQRRARKAELLKLRASQDFGSESFSFNFISPTDEELPRTPDTETGKKNEDGMETKDDTLTTAKPKYSPERSESIRSSSSSRLSSDRHSTFGQSPEQGGIYRRGAEQSPDERGAGQSPDERGAGQSPDERGAGQSPDQRGIGQSPDQRGAGQSPDQRGIGRSPDVRGAEQSPDQRGAGQSPDQRGAGQSPDQRIGQSPNQRGAGQSPDQRIGQSPDERGAGQSPDQRVRHSPDQRIRHSSKSSTDSWQLKSFNSPEQSNISSKNSFEESKNEVESPEQLLNDGNSNSTAEQTDDSSLYSDTKVMDIDDTNQFSMGDEMEIGKN